MKAVWDVPLCLFPGRVCRRLAFPSSIFSWIQRKPPRLEVCFVWKCIFLYLLFLFLFFLNILFIHRDRERERQRHRQRKKQAPCTKPDMGLDPGSPGSCPGLQVALNRCATGATRPNLFLYSHITIWYFSYLSLQQEHKLIVPIT